MTPHHPYHRIPVPRVPFPFPIRRGMGQAVNPYAIQTYDPKTTASGITKTVTGATGAGLLAAAPFTGPAAPFVAAAGALLELVSACSALYSGCGATCVEATNIINQVEPLMIQNMQLYFTNPNRTECDQQAALNTFDSMWTLASQQCSNPALGAAGQKCISDRAQGSCAYGKTQPNTYPPYASVPYQVGVCWNWFVGYRDPIANDVPPGGSCVIGNVLGGLGLPTTGSIAGIPIEYLGIGAFALLLFLFI